MIQKREHISKPLFFIDYATTVDHIYTPLFFIDYTTTVDHIYTPLFFIDYTTTADHIYTLFLKRDKKSCTCYSSYDLIDFIVFQSQKVVF